MKFKTAIGKTVKLTPSRQEHIITTHPIMEFYLGKFKEVLSKPNDIRYSSRTDDVLLFYRFFDSIENGKYIVVVVNIAEEAIKTAYLTHRIKAGTKYEES